MGKVPNFLLSAYASRFQSAPSGFEIPNAKTMSLFFFDFPTDPFSTHSPSFQVTPMQPFLSAHISTHGPIEGASLVSRSEAPSDSG